MCTRPHDSNGGKAVCVGVRNGIRGCNSRISASIVVPTECLGSSSPGSLTTRYVRSVSGRFMGGMGRNSVVITNMGFNYNSSERRTPLTVGTTNISYMVTGGFTEVFCEGTLGVNLPVLRYPRTNSRVRRNSRISMSFSDNMVASGAANGDCQTRPFPPFVRSVVGGNKLLSSLGWSWGQTVGGFIFCDPFCFGFLAGLFACCFWVCFVVSSCGEFREIMFCTGQGGAHHQ